MSVAELWSVVCHVCSGYQLDASTGQDSVRRLARFVKKTFPGSRVIERHHNSIKCRIPKSPELKLGDLFRYVHQNTVDR